MLWQLRNAGLTRGRPRRCDPTSVLCFLVFQGAKAFLLGAGATSVGYLLYGGVSFGLTEFLKRRFVELAGPDLSALYPIPILLGARCEA